MTAGLWPALLAALLGRAGLHEAGSSEGQLLLLDWIAAAVTGQNAVYCWIGLLCFVLLAYLTNPSDASFRAHLTDLSFRLHLKRLQAAEPDTSAAFSAPGGFKTPAPIANTPTAAGPGKVNTHNSSTSGSTSAPKDKSRKDTQNGHAASVAGLSSGKKQQHVSQQQPKGKPASINGDNGRPHVLSFSNRVTISLKTPSYVRTSYALFSTVKILPAPLPTSQKARVASQSSRKASIKGKKVIANSATGSSAAKVDSASIKKRGGFVSSLANNLVSIASTNPWVEQGGYFIGILGYWWTIDDGTSTSGAREKTRTANAILAVEEQVDDEVSVSESKLDEPRSPQSLEDGQITPVDSSSKQIAGAPTAANSENALNGTSGASNSNNRSKHIQRLANSSSSLASFRAGQRRSSPTPRLVVTSTGTRNTTKRANSGEVSPLPVSSPDTAPMSTGEGSSAQRNQSDPLDLDADKNLPGLPFHVDASTRNKTLSPTNVVGGNGRTEAEAAIKLNGQSAIPVNEGRDGQLVTVSHTAPAADQESSTVSPACALLQNQLDELRATSETTQARLNAELEELRTRKTDEDNVRTELKSRMKNLEDVKRSAEQNRLEAEKKLISARAQKKTVEDRVTKVKNELSKVEKREKEHNEKVAKTRQERAERLSKLREDVSAREDVVEKEVEATERLSTRVQQLEGEIEERKGELVHLRDEAAQAARLRMNAGRGPPPMSAMVPRHPSSHPASNSSPNLNQYYENASSAGMPYSSVPHPHPHSHVNQPLSSEDNARPASPSRTPPGFTSAQAAPGHAGSAKADVHGSHYAGPFGNSFLEHRLQHRRPPHANTPVPVSNAAVSKLHSNVLGSNRDPSASSLYHRQLREGPTSYGGETESEDMSGILGTFAPFGPPGSPDLTLSSGLKELDKSALAGQSSHLPAEDDSSPLEDAIIAPKKTTPPATNALGKPTYLGGIGTRRLDAPQLERKHSGSSESSSVNGAAHMLNPLSPMTPHQASLIPSQLFDMLDDVEMPTSPSPTLSAAHQAFSHGINRHNSDDQGDRTQGDASPISLANRPINIGGTASAWDSLDDFPFDAPMSSLSRKVSNSRVDSKNFSSQSPIGQSGSVRDLAVSPPESIFSHGARSAASAGESLSPSLTSATSQSSSGKMSAFTATSSSSPHEYSLFEKARHALSLNPDAKAFSFNRPLPASSSFGQLRPQVNHQDAKAAFEGHTASNMHMPPGLKHNHNATPSTSSLELGGSSKTWASPIGAYRSIPGSSSSTDAFAGSASAVGHGKPSSPSAAAIVNGSNHRTTSAGSSFSPFDDDDLLKGW